MKEVKLLIEIVGATLKCHLFGNVIMSPLNDEEEHEWRKGR